MGLRSHYLTRGRGASVFFSGCQQAVKGVGFFQNDWGGFRTHHTRLLDQGSGMAAKVTCCLPADCLLQQLATPQHDMPHSRGLRHKRRIPLLFPLPFQIQILSDHFNLLLVFEHNLGPQWIHTSINATNMPLFRTSFQHF